MTEDHVDFIISQWRREMPDLDTFPMGVIGRLSRAADHLDRLLNKDYSRFSLNGGEFDVLASLRRLGEPYQLTPTELYNSLMITSGTMTNRLDRLEKAALISRSPNPDDRRGIIVTLTVKGLELMNRAYPSHISHEKKLLAALTGEECETLSKILRKLILSFEK